jgi:hypothetical protein
MTKSGEEEGEAFAAFMRDLPPDVRNQIMEQERVEALQDHEEFRAQFRAGRCSLCSEELTHFDAKRPCPHWLLLRGGFRKKHLPALALEYGMQRTQAYLRWVANEDGFAKNIADTSEEAGDDVIVATTIRYKDLEWSFSCTISDLRGHQNSRHAFTPHFHFQMRVEGRPLINYNQFHLPLSKSEIATLWAINKNSDMKSRWLGGQSMDDLLSMADPETLVRESLRADDPETAQLRIQTFLEAEPGTTINGDDLYALITEAKEKGVSVASLFHKLPSNVRVQTVVGPGPGAVEPAPRTPTRGRAD